MKTETTRNFLLGKAQFNKRNKMIDVNAVIGGRQIFAIAVISMLPVSTLIFATSHEEIPATAIIIAAVIRVK